MPLGNALLDRLPDALRDRLTVDAERVTLPARTPLFRAREPMATVHFPLTGVLSLVARLRDGAAVEVGMIGNEGTSGVQVLLGTETSAVTECMTLVRGDHLALPAATLRRAIDEDPAVRSVVARYASALIDQIGQAVACTATHSTKERAARWLLTAHDRIPDGRLPVTHELLGALLGVRRASITEAMAAMKSDSVIDTARGAIVVLDRAGLERASCECYAALIRAHAST